MPTPCFLLKIISINDAIPVRSRLYHESITYCLGIRAHISIQDFISIGVSIHISTGRDMEVCTSTQRDTTPNTDTA